jgi:hypothetical protein
VAGQAIEQPGRREECTGRVERPAGTLDGLCQRVTALVCSTHHDCALPRDHPPNASMGPYLVIRLKADLALVLPSSLYLPIRSLSRPSFRM